MQTILQSGFLQALAFALLNSVWQMGLLWLAIIFILSVIKLSSSQKFAIAFSGQLIGFGFFIYTLSSNDNHQTTSSFFNVHSLNYLSNSSSFLQYILPFVAILYLAVFVWHVIKFVFSYRFTQNLRNKNLEKIPAVNRVFVEELSALFSLHRKVKIYISKTIKCPLTIGFFKPVILIPLGAVNHLTKEQMEAVILHELAHIKRADYFFYLLECIIEKVFFFNIFSRMISSIIERERENACDDWVLQFKYNSFHYAEALLKLGRLQTSLAMAASGKKENMLLYRIKRMVHGNEKIKSYNYTAIHFSLLTLLIALGLMISFSVKTPEVITSLNKPSDKKIDQIYEAVNNVSDKMIAEQPAKKIKNKQQQEVKKEHISASVKTIASFKKESKTATHNDEIATSSVVPNPNYFVSVNQPVDVKEQTDIDYTQALNSQVILNNDAYKKAMSYQNFKQLETMLALTGDSITVKEDPASANEYKKLITIETTDKKGNKNVYKVIVELYQ